MMKKKKKPHTNSPYKTFDFKPFDVLYQLKIRDTDREKRRNAIIGGKEAKKRKYSILQCTRCIAPNCKEQTEMTFRLLSRVKAVMCTSTPSYNAVK